MNDSNRTLRFPRTAREAGIYGPIGDDEFSYGKLAIWIIAMTLFFTFGYIFGASDAKPCPSPAFEHSLDRPR